MPDAVIIAGKAMMQICAICWLREGGWGGALGVVGTAKLRARAGRCLPEDAHIDAEGGRLEEESGEEDDEHQVGVNVLQRDEVVEEVA